MDTPIVNQIKRRLEEKGLSVRALERLAGLSLHSVNNILSGKSKKLSAEVLFSISKALECSMEDLLEQKPHLKIEKFHNPKMLLEITEFLVKNHEEKIKEASPPLLLKKIIDIYEYSISKNNGNFSKSFAEWVMEN